MPTGDSQISASKLAAQVAHELNNPLDAVLRYVSLAQRKSQAGNYSDVERHLAEAQFGLQRMAETLKQLMDLGRQTNEVLGGTERRVMAPLAEIIEQARRAAMALADDRGVAVLLENCLAMEPEPRFDVRLGQVILNLLKNAVEASPEAGVVRVSVMSTADSMLEIVVADDGPGVSEEVMEQLYTPFMTTKGTGHGLGLATSRELVTAMQGVMKVRNWSAPKHGCVATVVLPVAWEHRSAIDG